MRSFQQVQFKSALQSSIRFLPHVIMGASINILTGYLISRVQVRTLVVASALVTMTASPIMATIQVHESYWRTSFWALLLSPANPDGMFDMTSFQALLIRHHSTLHCVQSRHIQCIPPRSPISCRRRIQ